MFYIMPPGKCIKYNNGYHYTMLSIPQIFHRTKTGKLWDKKNLHSLLVEIKINNLILEVELTVY